MAHFITLFFLSIGLNFGNTTYQSNQDLVSQKQANFRTSKQFMQNNNKTRSKSRLYADYKGTKLVKPIGSGGWENEGTN